MISILLYAIVLKKSMRKKILKDCLFFVPGVLVGVTFEQNELGWVAIVGVSLTIAAIILSLIKEMRD